jgi:hypothetical protein
MIETEPTSPVESVTVAVDVLDAEIKERQRSFELEWAAGAAPELLTPDTILEYVRREKLTPAEAIRILGNRRPPIPSKVGISDRDARKERIAANAAAIDKIYAKLAEDDSDAADRIADPIREIRIAERKVERELCELSATLDNLVAVRNSDHFSVGNQVESVFLDYVTEGTIEISPVLVQTLRSVSSRQRQDEALLEGLFEKLRDGIEYFSDSYYEIYHAIRAFDESQAPEPPAPAEPKQPTR